MSMGNELGWMVMAPLTLRSSFRSVSFASSDLAFPSVRQTYSMPLFDDTATAVAPPMSETGDLVLVAPWEMRGLHLAARCARS